MEPVPRHALQRQLRATVGQTHDPARLHDAAEPRTAHPIRQVGQESLLRGVVELPRVTADQSEGGIRAREGRLGRDRAGEVDDRPGEGGAADAVALHDVAGGDSALVPQDPGRAVATVRRGRHMHPGRTHPVQRQSPQHRGRGMREHRPRPRGREIGGHHLRTMAGLRGELAPGPQREVPPTAHMMQLPPFHRGVERPRPPALLLQPSTTEEHPPDLLHTHLSHPADSSSPLATPPPSHRSPHPSLPSRPLCRNRPRRPTHPLAFEPPPCARA